MLSSLLLGLALHAFNAVAVPLVERAAPTVTLESSSFTGVTSGQHTKFLGIPFAQPPYVSLDSSPFSRLLGPLC